MKLEFHHVNLCSHDVPELDAFYGEVLKQAPDPAMEPLRTVSDDIYDRKITFRTDGRVGFHIAHTDHELGFRMGSGINPLATGHIAFRTDDIEAFKAHLETHGIPYADYGTTFSTSWYQIFFHDPAGTVVEVHQVVDGSEDQA